ncbi:MAG: YheT family hydrolase [Burkholderiales bacterium]
MNHYRAPRWLAPPGAAGGHVQTIWPALFSKRFHGQVPHYRRERWTTPDDDFVDVDWLDNATHHNAAKPTQQVLLVLFHGLEGSSRSHYAQAFAHRARELGWRYAVPHFRGCSGELNLAPRAYHSGDHTEIGWMLQQLCRAHCGPVVAVGISLGGNALLRWAQEEGEAARHTVQAVAAVSAPLDLAAGARAIGQGFSQLSYSRMFLRSMKPRALAKWQQHPGLFDREKLGVARTLFEFDNVFTAPVHGFRDANHYYQQSSAKPHLARIRVPALVLNARNDPFLPEPYLPHASEVGQHVTLWQPKHGGHVGFPGGGWPGHVLTLPQQVTDWMRLKLDAVCTNEGVQT